MTPANQNHSAGTRKQKTTTKTKGIHTLVKRNSAFVFYILSCLRLVANISTFLAWLSGNRTDQPRWWYIVIILLLLHVRIYIYVFVCVRLCCIVVLSKRPALSPILIMIIVIIHYTCIYNNICNIYTMNENRPENHKTVLKPPESFPYAQQLSSNSRNRSEAGLSEIRIESWAETRKFVKKEHQTKMTQSTCRSLLR